MPSPKLRPSRVPQALIDAILAGDCVAFVGAGFSSPVVPGWKGLLRDVARKVLQDNPSATGLTQVLKDLNRTKLSAFQLEAAGELVKRAAGTPKAFEAAVRSVMAGYRQGPLAQRCQWLREIPFHAILTTNFDHLLPDPAPRATPRWDVLRRPHPWWQRADWEKSREEATPIVKLHGIANGNPRNEPVVLARSDYRKLVHEDGQYANFVRSVFATKKVLFLGTSFTDAYLNELRSSVLAMFKKRPCGEHLAWAISPLRSPAERSYFQDTEGIDLLEYAVPKKKDGTEDHGGFDQWLERVHRETSTVGRLYKLVGGKTLVWIDANHHRGNNVHGMQLLRSAKATVETLAEWPWPPSPAHERWASTVARADLVITHWGQGPGQGPSRAFRLLRDLNTWPGGRPPVIVFGGADDAPRRRLESLRHGAIDYCHQWQDLFRLIEQVFRPSPLASPVASE